MDGHIHRVLILVDDFNHLLHHIALWHTHQAAKATHAVVDVYHVVSYLKLLQLLQCQCHFAFPSLVALQVVLVETVKNLVVGEAAEFQRVVDETLMDGSVDRDEMDGLHFRLGHLLKDILQSCNLLLAVGKDTDFIPLIHEAVKLLIHQFKVLVEEGLRRGVEMDRPTPHPPYWEGVVTLLVSFRFRHNIIFLFA